MLRLTDTRGMTMQVRRLSMVAGAVLMLSLGANASAVVGGQCVHDDGAAGDAYYWYDACTGDSPSQGVDVFQVSGSSGTLDTYTYVRGGQQNGFTSVSHGAGIAPGVSTYGDAGSSDSLTGVVLVAGGEDASVTVAAFQYTDGQGCHQREHVAANAAGQSVFQPAEHGCASVPGVPAVP